MTCSLSDDGRLARRVRDTLAAMESTATRWEAGAIQSPRADGLLVAER